MNSFKKDLACNITLIAVLVFSAIHFLLLTLNLFGVIALGIREDFNYIFAYVLIALCLVLYVLGFFVVRLKNVEFPAWLRICFYVAFYLFTNVYYIFGLHDNVVGLIFLFAYLTFLANVISVSVFYNVQKDEKHRLKTSKNFILTSIFFYSLGSMLIVELLSVAFKAFIPLSLATASVHAVVVEVSTILLVTLIMTLVFDLSLQKSKKLINGCLIKTRFAVSQEKPKEVSEAKQKPEKSKDKDKKQQAEKTEPEQAPEQTENANVPEQITNTNEPENQSEQN